MKIKSGNVLFFLLLVKFNLRVVSAAACVFVCVRDGKSHDELTKWKRNKIYVHKLQIDHNEMRLPCFFFILFYSIPEKFFSTVIAFFLTVFSIFLATNRWKRKYFETNDWMSVREKDWASFFLGSIANENDDQNKIGTNFTSVFIFA